MGVVVQKHRWKIVLLLLLLGNVGMVLYSPRTARAEETGCVFAGGCHCINPGTKGGICSEQGLSSVDCHTQSTCTKTELEP